MQNVLAVLARLIFVYLAVIVAYYGGCMDEEIMITEHSNPNAPQKRAIFHYLQELGDSREISSVLPLVIRDWYRFQRSVSPDRPFAPSRGVVNLHLFYYLCKDRSALSSTLLSSPRLPPLPPFLSLFNCSSRLPSTFPPTSSRTATL